jgi:hypothetical protein
MEQVTQPKSKRKLLIGVRIDPDTERMIKEVASIENRTLNQSLKRLARIGYSHWVKYKDSHNNAYF